MGRYRFPLSSAAAGALVSPDPSAEVGQQREVHCGVSVATFQVAVTHPRQVHHDGAMGEGPVRMHTVVPQGCLRGRPWWDVVQLTERHIMSDSCAISASRGWRNPQSLQAVQSLHQWNISTAGVGVACVSAPGARR